MFGTVFSVLERGLPFSAFGSLPSTLVSTLAVDGVGDGVPTKRCSRKLCQRRISRQQYQPILPMHNERLQYPRCNIVSTCTGT